MTQGGGIPAGSVTYTAILALEQLRSGIIEAERIVSSGSATIEQKLSAIRFLVDTKGFEATLEAAKVLAGQAAAEIVTQFTQSGTKAGEGFATGVSAGISHGGVQGAEQATTQITAVFQGAGRNAGRVFVSGVDGELAGLASIGTRYGEITGANYSASLAAAMRNNGAIIRAQIQRDSEIINQESAFFHRGVAPENALVPVSSVQAAQTRQELALLAGAQPQFQSGSFGATSGPLQAARLQSIIDEEAGIGRIAVAEGRVTQAVTATSAAFGTVRNATEEVATSAAALEKNLLASATVVSQDLLPGIVNLAGPVAIAVGATVVLTSGISAVAKATSEAAAIGLQMKLVFGGAADEFKRFADNEALAFGQTRTGAESAITQFGRIQQVVKLTDDQVKQLSLRANDIAAATGQPVEDVGLKIERAFVGQPRGLGTLGIELQNKVLQDSFAQLGTDIEGNVNKLTLAQHTLVAYNALLDQTARYQNAAADAANSNATAFERLGSATTNLAATIGSPFLPVASAAADFINNLATGLDVAAQAAEKFVSSLGSIHLPHIDPTDASFLEFLIIHGGPIGGVAAVELGTFGGLTKLGANAKAEATTANIAARAGPAGTHTPGGIEQFQSPVSRELSQEDAANLAEINKTAEQFQAAAGVAKSKITSYQSLEQVAQAAHQAVFGEGFAAPDAHRAISEHDEKSLAQGDEVAKKVILDQKAKLVEIYNLYKQGQALASEIQDTEDAFTRQTRATSIDAPARIALVDYVEKKRVEARELYNQGQQLAAGITDAEDAFTRHVREEAVNSQVRQGQIDAQIQKDKDDAAKIIAQINERQSVIGLANQNRQNALSAALGATSIAGIEATSSGDKTKADAAERYGVQLQAQIAYTQKLQAADAQLAQEQIALHQQDIIIADAKIKGDQAAIDLATENKRQITDAITATEAYKASIQDTTAALVQQFDVQKQNEAVKRSVAATSSTEIANLQKEIDAQNKATDIKIKDYEHERDAKIRTAKDKLDAELTAIDADKRAADHAYTAATDALDKDTQAKLDAIDKEAEAAQKAHDAEIARINREEAASKKKIQAELDGIDQVTRARDASRKQEDDQARIVAALQAIQHARTPGELGTAREELRSVQTQQQRDAEDAATAERRARLEGRLGAVGERADSARSAADDALKRHLEELKKEREEIEKLAKAAKDALDKSKKQQDEYFEDRTKAARKAYETEIALIHSVYDDPTTGLIAKAKAANDAVIQNLKDQQDAWTAWAKFINNYIDQVKGNLEKLIALIDEVNKKAGGGGGFGKKSGNVTGDDAGTFADFAASFGAGVPGPNGAAPQGGAGTLNASTNVSGFHESAPQGVRATGLGALGRTGPVDQTGNAIFPGSTLNGNQVVNVQVQGGAVGPIAGSSDVVSRLVAAIGGSGSGGVSGDFQFDVAGGARRGTGSFAPSPTPGQPNMLSQNGSQVGASGKRPLVIQGPLVTFPNLNISDPGALEAAMNDAVAAAVTAVNDQQEAFINELDAVYGAV